MINPLIEPIEVFLEIYFCLPLAIRSYIDLRFGVILVTSIIAVMFRAKH